MEKARQCHTSPCLCGRYGIASLATNDIRYTERETDKRQNRKMSCYSTNQPEPYFWNCGCFCVCLSSKQKFFCSGRRYWSIFLVLLGWQSQLTRTLHHFKKWHCRWCSKVSQTRISSWERIYHDLFENLCHKRRPDLTPSVGQPNYATVPFLILFYALLAESKLDWLQLQRSDL